MGFITFKKIHLNFVVHRLDFGIINQSGENSRKDEKQSSSFNPICHAEGALAGVQGCTAPPFFENYHTAPPNFRLFIDNAPKVQWISPIFILPLKLCIPVFKFLPHPQLLFTNQVADMICAISIVQIYTSTQA